jgi:hypothetical protein
MCALTQFFKNRPLVLGICFSETRLKNCPQGPPVWFWLGSDPYSPLAAGSSRACPPTPATTSRRRRRRRRPSAPTATSSPCGASSWSRTSRSPTPDHPTLARWDSESGS